MKIKKYFGIVIIIGIILSVSGIVIADSKKIKNQVEVTRDNAETEIQKIINTEEKKLIYSSTLPRGEKIYRNEAGDLYFFGDNGKVTEYAVNIDAVELKERKADESEVLKAAEGYLESLVQDTSYYELNYVDYDEYVCAYSIMYIHKIGDYDTNDIVYIGIDNELNLILFSVPRPYAFEGMESVEIEPENIEWKALEKFYQKYSDNYMDVKVTNIQFGTDDMENIGFQVYLECYYMMNDEKVKEGDIIFVPYLE